MASEKVPEEHNRFPYSAIVDRKKLDWPNGARVAVWVIPNIEHFLFDRPSASISPGTAGFSPDVLNYGWRDYGARVGIWRIMDIMEKRGFSGTVALNSDVCNHYPRIIDGIKDLKWEIMGHGPNNSMVLSTQDEATERTIIKNTLSTIESAAGKRPRGWLGPALTETVRTPDILAENGVDYLADWTNDDQPYRIKVKSGSLYAIPYSLETNDYTFFLTMNQSAETFGHMLQDQFDVLYEDGATTGRVMAICLHPFLVGHPYRAKYLDQALAHIGSRSEVWLTTGSEIIDHYRHVVGDA
jgi:peptidoglycan/xylan/chitin deacetylase (PgdA/CDA1 family)